MRSLYRLGVALGVAAFAACTSPAVNEVNARVGGAQKLLGIWVPDAAPRALLTSDGKSPPLTSEASKLYSERRQRLAAGDAAFDPTSWCAGPGMPRILTMQYPWKSALTPTASLSSMAGTDGFASWI